MDRKVNSYIKKGYMDADEDVTFTRHADACNCFGHSFKQYYRSVARHAVKPELSIWFPNLYDDPDWDNRLSDDEETLYERNKHDKATHIRTNLSHPELFKRLVFAKEFGPHQSLPLQRFV